MRRELQSNENDPAPYRVCVASAADRYSLTTFDYKQLLFMVTDMLVEVASECDTIEKRDLSAVKGWFDERHIKDTKRRGYSVEAKAGGKLPLLRALFAGFGSKLWTSGVPHSLVVRAARSGAEL